jgi:hypothetical protein
VLGCFVPLNNTMLFQLERSTDCVSADGLSEVACNMRPYLGVQHVVLLQALLVPFGGFGCIVKNFQYGSLLRLRSGFVTSLHVVSCPLVSLHDHVSDLSDFVLAKVVSSQL